MPAVCLLLVAAAAGGRADQPAAGDLAATAREAYIFAFPLYEFERLRHLAGCSPFNPHHTPPNRFHHRRTLSDDRSRAVTTPNADTLYSSAFLDLSRGPVLLKVPAVVDRYYSLAFIDAFTNNFASVGTRTSGGKAVKYLIVGPGGRSSPGAAPVIASPTDSVWLLGRFLVTGLQDLPAVHREQDALQLVPAGDNAEPQGCNGPAPAPGDPWNFFAVVGAALTRNPPPPRDAAMVARLATIDIAPGRHFDPSRFNPVQQEALLAGIADAGKEIAQTRTTGKVVNGWAYPLPGIGNFGTDYQLRAATALKGLGALDPSEAMYLPHVGEALEGDHRYRMHFDPGNLPPVRAFWSLSAYQIRPDQRRFFAANPIGRYSIGDQTPGLRRNADGSLDVLIQHASPGEGRESNWLPAPAGRFALTLRAYLPGPPLLDGTYAPPALERQP